MLSEGGKKMGGVAPIKKKGPNTPAKRKKRRGKDLITSKKKKGPPSICFLGERKGKGEGNPRPITSTPRTKKPRQGGNRQGLQGENRPVSCSVLGKKGKKKREDGWRLLSKKKRGKKKMPVTLFYFLLGGKGKKKKRGGLAPYWV